MPGPNGGALSQRLRLEIVDRTDLVGRPVYRGPFATLGVRPIGFIAAGGERDYRFTAMLPDSGGPASPVSGDNVPLKGSSTSARFVWSAVQGGAPRAPAGRPSEAAAEGQAPAAAARVVRQGPTPAHAAVRGHASVVLRRACRSP